MPEQDSVLLKPSVWAREHYPRTASWLAAFYLAFFWTGIYLTVFFLTTWIMDLKTSVEVMIGVLWFSVVAESTVRMQENSQIIAILTKSKDSPGDNHDLSVRRVVVLILGGMVAYGLLLYFLYRTGFTDESGLFSGQEFKGQGELRSMEAFWTMVFDWGELFKSSKVGLGVMACITFRALIYKRKVQE